MNDFELFLNFGAVVEIRKNYRDDLYNFIKLILDLGFMNEEITYFINAMRIIGKDRKMANNLAIADKIQLLDEYFEDEYFWHIIDINEGRTNRICIEYQLGKGLTFGKELDYTSYDDTIKVLSVEELIKACSKAEDFGLEYTETSFMEELPKEDEELAISLTDFCEWYEWELVKYSNGLYNIRDIQTEEFVGYFNNERGTLRECIERVFYRMVDYFTDEQEHEDIEFVEKDIERFKRLGTQYNLYKEDDIKWLDNWLKEEIEFLEEE